MVTQGSCQVVKLTVMPFRSPIPRTEVSMSTCQSLAIAFENLNGFCRRSRTGGASLESGVCVGNGTASIIMLGVSENVTRRNALEDEANIAFVWHAVDSTTL